MNIEQVLNNNNPQLAELNGMIQKITGDKSFNLMLDMNNAESFSELLNDLDIGNPVAAEQMIQQANINPALKEKFLKNIKNLAEKQTVLVNLKNMDNLKLFLHNYDASNKSEKFNIDLDSLDKKDVDFIADSLNNPNMVLTSVNQQNFQLNMSVPTPSGEVSYKSFNVSKGLSDLIEYAYKSQKPVRLDFDGDSSVILRIDQNGLLSAQFLSSDKAMESLLRNNLQHLRNKFDSEGIPYKELTYKDNNRRNKENKGG